MEQDIDTLQEGLEVADDQIDDEAGLGDAGMRCTGSGLC